MIDYGLSHSFCENFEYYKAQKAIIHGSDNPFHEKTNKMKDLDKRCFIKDKYDPKKSLMSGFKGNLMYQSKFVYEGHTAQKRDDIISMLYILVHMVKPDFFEGPQSSNLEQ